MTLVRSHWKDETFYARHFRHENEKDADCGGGEDPYHKRMKSVLLSKLKDRYPDYTKSWLDRGRLPSPTGTAEYRVPDARIQFSEPHPVLGNGVVGEFQHLNEGKDKEAVEEDYLREGYSVYWVDEDDVVDMDIVLGDPITVLQKMVPTPDEWSGIEYDLSPRELRNVGKGSEGEFVGSTYNWLVRNYVDDQFDVHLPLGVEISVRLPEEYYTALATDYFRDTAWEDLFPGYEHSLRDPPVDSSSEDVATKVRLPDDYYAALADGLGYNRPCMAEKDGCPGPDESGVKCFHCSGVENNRITYQDPTKQKPECVAERHWCSGRQGTRAICDDCS